MVKERKLGGEIREIRVNEFQKYHCGLRTIMTNIIARKSSLQ